MLRAALLNTGFYGGDCGRSGLWGLTAGKLELAGGSDADFGDLEVNGFQLFGTGHVTLGQATTLVPATVAGTFELVIPSGVAARIIGEAVVPLSWDKLDDGAKSPTAGDGWVISVPVGSKVTIIEG